MGVPTAPPSLPSSSKASLQVTWYGPWEGYRPVPDDILSAYGGTDGPTGRSGCAVPTLLSSKQKTWGSSPHLWTRSHLARPIRRRLLRAQSQTCLRTVIRLISKRNGQRRHLLPRSKELPSARSVRQLA